MLFLLQVTTIFERATGMDRQGNHIRTRDGRREMGTARPLRLLGSAESACHLGLKVAFNSAVAGRPAKGLAVVARKVGQLAVADHDAAHHSLVLKQHFGSTNTGRLHHELRSSKGSQDPIQRYDGRAGGGPSSSAHAVDTLLLVAR